MNDIRSGMVVSPTSLAALVLAAVLASFAVWVWPHLTGSPTENIDPTDITDQADELEAKRTRLWWEIESADRLAAKLTDGSLSLVDAVAQMEPLLRDRIDFENVSRNHYRAPNLRLGTARYLIAKVGYHLDGDPGRWAAASQRLEAEYAAMR